jgi:pimeloyl-ACP methyl ester carboxylesterase
VNYFLNIVFTLIVILCSAQNGADVRKLQVNYKDTNVDYVVLSKLGDKDVKKPLFIFCQGSLSRPLQIKSGDSAFPLLPFDLDIILKNYHLILISKPGIPLSEDVKNLNSDYSYPKDKLAAKEYIINNNLDYYYKRNNFILNKLLKEKWVDKKKIVVAGHSEGSYVALEMATHNTKITNLIYSGGNPLGRIMSIINENRQDSYEKENDEKETLEFWQKTVENKDKKELTQENTSFYQYTLSQDFTRDLLKLKIPVLVTYGTKGQNAIFNDYLNVLTIQNHKTNFTFITFFNCEHNFFPIKKNGEIDYTVDNWRKVAYEWIKWSFIWKLILY